MAHDRAFVRQPNGDPLITQALAYHLENETFVSYLEGQAVRLGICLRDETVEEVPSGETGVAGLRLSTGELLTADLYVDCSGFRSFLLGRTLNGALRQLPLVALLRPSGRQRVGPNRRADQTVHDGRDDELRLVLADRA